MGALNHSLQTRARVIEEFRRTGRVDLACASAGVSRTCHYDWLAADEDYKKSFERARGEVNGLLEDEAIRRAYHGTAKPVTVGGKVVMMTEFSDNLLMFLLKCRNPKVFGDKREDTLHVDGQLSVAEVIRQRRFAREAQEKLEESQVIDVAAQIESGVQTETRPGLAETPAATSEDEQ